MAKGSGFDFGTFGVLFQTQSPISLIFRRTQLCASTIPLSQAYKFFLSLSLISLMCFPAHITLL